MFNVKGRLLQCCVRSVNIMRGVGHNTTVVTSATSNSDGDLVSDLRLELKNLQRSLSKECCIYSVPGNLRRVNEAAYTPQFVSIGPFHYDNVNLKKMEKHKLRYLERFLKRAEGRANLEDFVDYVKAKEETVRRCYADTFDHLNRDQFARMILVDASFIIEHILRPTRGRLPDERSKGNQLIFDIPPLKSAVVTKDMTLLENQLPFFVLEELHRMAFQNENETFSQISHNFFTGFNYQGKPMPEDFKHFTELVRYYQLPKKKDEEEEKNAQTQNPTVRTHKSCFSDCSSRLYKVLKFCRSRLCKVLKRVFGALLRVGCHVLLVLCCPKPGEAKEIDGCDLFYSATQLHEAGVSFLACPSKIKCLFDINFTDEGELEMPCFTIDDDTEALMRNVMALEQCCCSEERPVCDYFLLIDSLISTDKDVDLLVQNKILVNQLGSNQEVASLVNKLGLEITCHNLETRRYKDTIKKLNAYYEVPHHKWIAALRHVYFKTPWRGASTIAAITLLLLTLAQTFCSIRSLKAI